MLLSVLAYSTSTGLYGIGLDDGPHMYGWSNDRDIWSILDSQKIRVPDFDARNIAGDGKIRILKRQDKILRETSTTQNNGKQISTFPN